MKLDNKLRSKVALFMAILGMLCVLQATFAVFLFQVFPDYSMPSLLIDYPFHSRISHEPILPLEHVWRDYKHWHSQDALERNLQNRTYQVIYYSCPFAAGNLLHDTFNQVIVAIALNRTMLWKYNDEVTCNATRKGYGGLVCLKSNTEDDCARSLIRAPWLPRYDDWKNELFPSDAALPVRNPANYSSSDWWEQPVVAFAPLVYQTSEKQLLSYQASFLTERNYSKETIDKLFASTQDVLFGMLFREIFSFTREIIPPEYDMRLYHGHKTFAIHSRHFNNKLNGTNTKKERECLTSMLNDIDDEDEETPCTVFLLSDRQVTIDILSTYIQSKWKRCVPVVATHVASDGHYLEHGPFAGAGFFQDLMVGSQARHGFIGHCYRTSSQLLREFIQYDRYMEALESTGSPPTDLLPVCCLPSTVSHE